MGQLQRALHENLATLPKLALRRILERKLQEQEIDLPPAAFEALLEHILSHNNERFTWTDCSADTGQQPRNLELVFDEKDAAQAQQLSDRLIATIPAIIETIADKSGADLFNTLRKNWGTEGAVQRYEMDEFRDRLEHRWGEGLQLLRMLLTVVRELGHDTIKKFRRSKSKKHAQQRFVLMHLHMRACQITAEIITLMENGFADGAMARWRTLHELDVVATLIADGDEELAARYTHHNVVDVKKQADDYDRTLIPLGYPPIRAQVRSRIEKNYADAIGRYGKPFGTDYGWAAALLNAAGQHFNSFRTKQINRR